MTFWGWFNIACAALAWIACGASFFFRRKTLRLVEQENRALRLLLTKGDALDVVEQMMRRQRFAIFNHLQTAGAFTVQGLGDGEQPCQASSLRLAYERMQQARLRRVFPDEFAKGGQR